MANSYKQYFPEFSDEQLEIVDKIINGFLGIISKFQLERTRDLTESELIRTLQKINNIDQFKQSITNARNTLRILLTILKSCQKYNESNKESDKFLYRTLTTPIITYWYKYVTTFQADELFKVLKPLNQYIAANNLNSNDTEEEKNNQQKYDKNIPQNWQYELQQAITCAVNFMSYFWIAKNTFVNNNRDYSILREKIFDNFQKKIKITEGKEYWNRIHEFLRILYDIERIFRGKRYLISRLQINYADTYTDMLNNVQQCFLGDITDDRINNLKNNYETLNEIIKNKTTDDENLKTLIPIAAIQKYNSNNLDERFGKDFLSKLNTIMNDAGRINRITSEQCTSIINRLRDINQKLTEIDIATFDKDADAREKAKELDKNIALRAIELITGEEKLSDTAIGTQELRQINSLESLLRSISSTKSNLYKLRLSLIDDIYEDVREDKSTLFSWGDMSKNSAEKAQHAMSEISAFLNDETKSQLLQDCFGSNDISNDKMNAIFKDITTLIKIYNGRISQQTNKKMTTYKTRIIPSEGIRNILKALIDLAKNQEIIKKNTKLYKDNNPGVNNLPSCISGFRRLVEDFFKSLDDKIKLIPIKLDKNNSPYVDESISTKEISDTINNVLGIIKNKQSENHPVCIFKSIQAWIKSANNEYKTGKTNDDSSPAPQDNKFTSTTKPIIYMNNPDNPDEQIGIYTQRTSDGWTNCMRFTILQALYTYRDKIQLYDDPKPINDNDETKDALGRETPLGIWRRLIKALKSQAQRDDSLDNKWRDQKQLLQGFQTRYQKYLNPLLLQDARAAKKNECLAKFRKKYQLTDEKYDSIREFIRPYIALGNVYIDNRKRFSAMALAWDEISSNVNDWCDNPTKYDTQAVINAINQAIVNANDKLRDAGLPDMRNDYSLRSDDWILCTGLGAVYVPERSFINQMQSIESTFKRATVTPIEVVKVFQNMVHASLGDAVLDKILYDENGAFSKKVFRSLKTEVASVDPIAEENNENKRGEELPYTQIKKTVESKSIRKDI